MVSGNRLVADTTTVTTFTCSTCHYCLIPYTNFTQFTDFMLCFISIFFGIRDSTRNNKVYLTLSTIVVSGLLSCIFMSLINDQSQ